VSQVDEARRSALWWFVSASLVFAAYPGLYFWWRDGWEAFHTLLVGGAWFCIGMAWNRRGFVEGWQARTAAEAKL